MKILRKNDLFGARDLGRSLARKSMQGGVTTMASQGMQFVLTIGSTAVLARLLTPADYGLIGMVTVIVNFAQMFKDAGLSMATVQKENISHNQISTLFWVNAMISVVLGCCILAGSPLVSLFYGKPELTAITAALSVSFTVSGLTIQHKALLRRHMQFNVLAGIQIAEQVVSISVTILLACLGWRYWALVCGTLMRAVADAALTFFVCRWIPGRIRRGTGAREMLLFGGHLTGFDFINYFSRNADNILIGKFIGTDALGLYAKAYGLFMMPIVQIRGPLANVSIPVLSSLKDQPERYAKYYQRIIDIIATLAMPLTMYCLIEAGFLIRMLLGERWLGVVPVFRILAMAGLIQAVAGTRGFVLLSQGLSKRYFYWGLANAVVTVGSFVAGIPFGIEGVAAAYTAVNYLLLLPSLFYCFRQTPVSVSMFLKSAFAPLPAGIAASLGLLAAKSFFPDLSVTGSLAGFAVFAAVYAALSLCRRPIRETVIMMSGSAGKFLSGRKAVNSGAR
jgi:O-antigen/teichoic acid export membrane protein